MNHDRTYRPVPHVPAPRLRDANGSMRQAPRRSAGHAATHPVQPLKGLPGTRATDVSYRALAPGGAGFCYRICTGTSEARPTANYSLLTANSSFTFSAKERDPETGYSYFGSRYYSSDLSVWLSVNPMASKYPSLSPYVYCADNPVKLVDPDGEEIDDNLDKWKYNKDTKELTWLSDEGGRYHQIVVETKNTPSGESVNRTVEFDGAIGQMFDFSVVSKKLDGMINGVFDVYGGFATSVAGAAIMSEGSVISGGAAFPVGAAIFSAGAYQSVNGLITIANAGAGRGVDMYEQQDIVRDICKSAGNSVASILSTSKNPKIQDVVKSIGKSTGSFILSATWTRFVRHATTHPTCNKVLPTGAIVH